MPRTRNRADIPLMRTAARAGTVALPPRQAGIESAGSVDVWSREFARRVTPSMIKAGLQACNALSCVDNIPGTPANDDKLANVRPACCQAAIDVDEPMYVVAKMFSAGEPGHEHSHLHGGGIELWMALGTAAAAGIGVWYGLRNMHASRQTASVLRRMRVRVEQQRATAPSPGAALPRPLPERQARRNDEARLLELRRAEGVHRFGLLHGGLQVCNGLLLLASVGMPGLAPFATAGMVVFCGMQAGAFWRARQAATAALPEVSRGEDATARAGARVFAQRRAERRAAFFAGACAHGTYAVGAGLLTLATATATAFLLWPGLLLLAAGMVAATATAKRCADHTFTSNSNADLNSETLGSKASMLRQLALLDREGRAVATVAALAPNNDTRAKRWVRACFVAVASWLNREEQAAAWAHRKRVATRRGAEPSGFAACVMQAGRLRLACLADEMAALAAKAERLRRGPDVDCVENTLNVLRQWTSAEEAWMQTCRHRCADPGAMAEMAWEWLTARRWQEEVLGSLCGVLDAQDMQQRWWILGRDAEPRLNAALWLQALRQKNPQAQRMWEALQPVLTDWLAGRQLQVTRNRIDALVNHLTARQARRLPSF